MSYEPSKMNIRFLLIFSMVVGNNISLSSELGVVNIEQLYSEQKLLPIDDKAEVFQKKTINPTNTLMQKGEISKNADEDSFGFSIDIDGERAIIGSLYDTVNTIRSGSAYVYKLNNTSWVFDQKLTPSSPSNNEFFGYDVSISGNRIVISSLQDRDLFPFVGSVFVFEYINNSWEETYKITSENVIGMGFGRSVDLSGNFLLIGDDIASSNNQRSGEAYLYELINELWVLKKTFTSSESGHNFGYDVSINENLVLIGTEFKNESFIFENSNGIWLEINQLQSSDLGEFDEFGKVLDIYEGQLFISSRRADNEIGAVYVFEKNNLGVWSELQKISPSDGVYSDYFGWSLAVDSGKLLIGSPSSSGEAESETGNAYLFEKIENLWIEVQKIRASDGEFIDRFGESVAISGSYLFVGAPGDDDIGVDSGGVYVYNITQNLIFKNNFEQE